MQTTEVPNCCFVVVIDGMKEIKSINWGAISQEICQTGCWVVILFQMRFCSPLKNRLTALGCWVQWELFLGVLFIKFDCCASCCYSWFNWTWRWLPVHLLHLSQINVINSILTNHCLGTSVDIQNARMLTGSRATWLATCAFLGRTPLIWDGQPNPIRMPQKWNSGMCLRIALWLLSYHRMCPFGTSV